jgi:hypothetical protein
MIFKNHSIFDSIVHPSNNNLWFGKASTNSFENLENDLLDHNFEGACAVSLPGITNEELVSFYDSCKSRTGITLFPVAAFDFTVKNFEQQIIFIKEIGYSAIKIHVRLSALDLDKDFDKMKDVFSLCKKHKMIIFFCTYYHTSIKFTPKHELTFYLISLLKVAPTVKIVLLHGGDVGLLNMMQLARFNSNILIDLSYTFMKFEDSSLRKDIVFLMNNFDQKICIGSDYPEYSIEAFKVALSRYLPEIANEEKVKRLLSENIKEFLDISV